MNISNDFLKYCCYSYAAGDFKNITGGKILVDLKKLDSLKYYDEILDFINTNFGEIGEGKDLDYPDGIKVFIRKDEDLIAVLAMRDDKQIFGSCWEPPKEKEE